MAVSRQVGGVRKAVNISKAAIHTLGWKYREDHMCGDWLVLR